MKIIPVWGRVIVKPDEIGETDEVIKSAKAAGLDTSAIETTRHQATQVEGTLYAVGGDAFADWKGRKPKEGERVIFDLYSGFEKTVDGVDYRIVSDTDIIAVLED